MTILRWISCHLIITILVVSTAIAWFFKEDLSRDYARLTGNNTATMDAGADQHEQPSVQAQVAQQATQKATVTPPPPPRSVDPVPGDPAPTVEATGMDVPVEQEQPPAAAASKFPPEAVPGVDSAAPAPEATQPDMANYPMDTARQAAVSSPPPMQQPVMPPAEVAVSADGPDSMFPPDDYDPETGRMMSAPEPASQMNMASRGPDTQPDMPTMPRFPEPMADQQGSVVPGNAIGSQDATDFDARLENARRLLWAGDLDNARHEYESLMASDPDNPEVASELGNLLMQQDRLDAASRVYDTAIGNFRRQSRDNEAIGLIRFISRYNPTLADSLYNKYWQ